MTLYSEQLTDRGPWFGRRLPVVALLLLTAVAGGLDAITFLFVGGVFVCNQTGNLLFHARTIDAHLTS